MIPMVGKKFGRLTVEAYHSHAGNMLKYACRCECGGVAVCYGSNLRNGHTKSCGCLCDGSFNVRHGKTNTRIWRIYQSMKTRCLSTGAANYLRYGGRGITICDHWLESFENFYEDMGDPPSKGHSLERIDNAGNYERENCRWATPKEQARNTRRNRLITFRGETKCLNEWAEITGLHRDTIAKRIKDGWSAEDAIGKPSRTQNKRKVLA